MGKSIELKLPAFAFVEGSGHENSGLEGRNVIIHIRSASIVEVLERDRCELKEDVVKRNFTYTNRYDIVEKKVVALHYCATLDPVADRQLIIDQVLIPAAKWFCDYCDWEDRNIAEGGAL